MLKTTVGQILVNEALPQDLRDYSRKLDGKTTTALLREIAQRYPDRYRELVKHLMDVGRDVSFTTGGMSFGLDDLRTPPTVLMLRKQLDKDVQRVLKQGLPKDQRDKQILALAAEARDKIIDATMREAKAAGNPLVMQVMSGARGNPMFLARLLAGDTLYTDYKGQVIPIPVLRSYSEGLRPAEYWAATYGGRKGLMEGKLGTGESGYLNKQLNQAAHRLLVTAIDEEDEAEDDDPKREHSTELRGLPVDVTDEDNEGALLAAPVKDYPRNTLLTPKVLADLKRSGVKKILVRSPIVGGPKVGGVYARDLGIRERGGLSPLGDLVGLAAAQAIGERLAQTSLKSKHSAGAGSSQNQQSGLDYLNRLIQGPKRFPEAAVHAQLDGKVTRIEPAPAGGNYVWVENKRHFIEPGVDVRVKPGDHVESGDVLSDGVPHPGEVVYHKGIGEGRRYLAQALTDGMRRSGQPVHRRNAELLARALIDHVEVTDPFDDYIPQDIVSYQHLERHWKPRDTSRSVNLKHAVGKYLEQPVLHYSIGTPIRPSVVRELQEHGVKSVTISDDPPPFRPKMIRAVANLHHDPDWFTRFLASHQKTNLLTAVARGDVSDERGTSFVPSLARSVDFGKTWPQSVLRPSK